MELKSVLESKFDNIVISGFVGREGSYEVSINGALVFSKLTTYGFPYDADIEKAIAAAQSNEEVATISNSQSPCIIL
ncbi:migration and invasion enhancer 1-like [Clavelina lepadiformis]|uniref:Migration and invasion enhancer 1 n=1 Tax=Clavelina lepadiformis TaxID=159417 RepID=A0ABP0H4S2_CLALP